MIKVVKPTRVPTRLQREGKTANEANCNAYDADPSSYASGSFKFNIENSIYGHATVKSVLKNAQHNKCCFCEKDQADETGAIEHFRPKGGYRSTKGQKLKKPGYYWLGYEWKNLFFVCSNCNSAGNKGNLFPLQDETQRAKSHNADITKESPLLLDPSGRKDPRNHIEFNGPFPKGKTVYGKKTIEICGLDRSALVDEREKLIGNIDARLAIIFGEIPHSLEDTNKANSFIRESIKPQAEFSGTALDYLSGYNLPIV